MTLPDTGVEWEAAYGFNPLGIRKGIITNVLARDYHGVLTNLRDPAVGLNDNGLFSPYAIDGFYRDDLLDPDFPGGQFYDVGALKDDGVSITPDVSVEGVKVAQARRSQRWDITDEDDEVMWTCRESNPVVDLLRFDMPLISVPDAGASGYSLAKPMNANLIERQIVALAEDGTFHFAYVFPRVARKKVGKTQLNKKDPDDLELTYGALPCPFADTPVYIVREGEGWRNQAGTPSFPGSAPVATQTGATSATVAFTTPILPTDPAPDEFTYVVEKSVSPYSSWTTATQGTTTVVGTTITIGITSLTTATAYKFRVKATSDSQLTGTSLSSNIATTA